MIYYDISDPDLSRNQESFDLISNKQQELGRRGALIGTIQAARHTKNGDFLFICGMTGKEYYIAFVKDSFKQNPSVGKYSMAASIITLPFFQILILDFILFHDIHIQVLKWQFISQAFIQSRLFAFTLQDLTEMDKSCFKLINNILDGAMLQKIQISGIIVRKTEIQVLSKSIVYFHLYLDLDLPSTPNPKSHDQASLDKYSKKLEPKRVRGLILFRSETPADAGLIYLIHKQLVVFKKYRFLNLRETNSDALLYKIEKSNPSFFLIHHETETDKMKPEKKVENLNQTMSFIDPVPEPFPAHLKTWSLQSKPTSAFFLPCYRGIITKIVQENGLFFYEIDDCHRFHRLLCKSLFTLEKNLSLRPRVEIELYHVHCILNPGYSTSTLETDYFDIIPCKQTYITVISFENAEKDTMLGSPCGSAFFYQMAVEAWITQKLRVGLFTVINGNHIKLIQNSSIWSLRNCKKLEACILHVESITKISSLLFPAADIRPKKIPLHASLMDHSTCTIAAKNYNAYPLSHITYVHEKMDGALESLRLSSDKSGSAAVACGHLELVLVCVCEFLPVGGVRLSDETGALVGVVKMGKSNLTGVLKWVGRPQLCVIMGVQYVVDCMYPRKYLVLEWDNITIITQDDRILEEPSNPAAEFWFLKPVYKRRVRAVFGEKGKCQLGTYLSGIKLWRFEQDDSVDQQDLLGYLRFTGDSLAVYQNLKIEQWYRVDCPSGASCLPLNAKGWALEWSSDFGISEIEAPIGINVPLREKKYLSVSEILDNAHILCDNVNLISIRGILKSKNAIGSIDQDAVCRNLISHYMGDRDYEQQKTILTLGHGGLTFSVHVVDDALIPLGLIPGCSICMDDIDIETRNGQVVGILLITSQIYIDYDSMDIDAKDSIMDRDVYTTMSKLLTKPRNPMIPYQNPNTNWVKVMPLSIKRISMQLECFACAKIVSELVCDACQSNAEIKCSMDMAVQDGSTEFICIIEGTSMMQFMLFDKMRVEKQLLLPKYSGKIFRDYAGMTYQEKTGEGCRNYIDKHCLFERRWMRMMGFRITRIPDYLTQIFSDDNELSINIRTKHKGLKPRISSTLTKEKYCCLGPKPIKVWVGQIRNFEPLREAITLLKEFTSNE